MNREFSFRKELTDERHLLLKASLAIRSDVGRDELLTDGVFAVVSFLAGALEGSGVKTATVVVVTGDSSPAASEAFIDAARGLVQSLTLERAGMTPAANIVICDEAADSPDVLAAVQFLQSPGGQFSRGTSFDLRGMS